MSTTNPFRSPPSSPQPYMAQQQQSSSSPVGSQLATSTSTTTNPFRQLSQQTQAQAGEHTAMPQPQPQQQAAQTDDLITNDLAGLDFSSPSPSSGAGVAPAMLTSSADQGSNVPVAQPGTYAPPAGPPPGFAGAGVGAGAGLGVADGLSASVSSGSSSKGKGKEQQQQQGYAIDGNLPPSNNGLMTGSYGLNNGAANTNSSSTTYYPAASSSSSSSAGPSIPALSALSATSASPFADPNHQPDSPTTAEAQRTAAAYDAQDAAEAKERAQKQEKADEAYARRIVQAQKRQAMMQRQAALGRRQGEEEEAYAQRVGDGKGGHGNGNGNQMPAWLQGSAGAGAGAAGAVPASKPRKDEEAQWSLKDVEWRGKERKIITQNENGPCSLIALCNVLLLRGDLTITPADRPAVSYSYLSSLLAEYLLLRSTTTSATAQEQGQEQDQLSAALSILPRTQYGLDVNVRFDGGIDSFDVNQPQASNGNVQPNANPAAGTNSNNGSSSQSTAGELALFKLCGVRLVHGWLPDPADAETYAALERCGGDYDRALDRVVHGDELAKGLLLLQEKESGGSGAGTRVNGENGNDDGNGGSARTEETQQLGSHLNRVQNGFKKGKQAERHLSEEETAIVKDALLIRDFLDSTSTQLSYHGLFVLAQTLQPGEMVALFRNSHLSVLYRRLPEEGKQQRQQQQETQPDLLGGTLAPDTNGNGSGSASSAEPPELFTLATDSAFLMEEEVVWESLADVDQAGSEFFDGKFRKTRIEGDWVGVDAQGHRRPNGHGHGAGAGGGGAVLDASGRMIPPGEDADFALAAQLQEEEQRRAMLRQTQHRQRQERHDRFNPGSSATSSPNKKLSSGLGGLLKRNKHKTSPSSGIAGGSEHGQVPNTNASVRAASQSAPPAQAQNIMDEVPQESLGAARTSPAAPSAGPGGKDKDKCSIM